MEHKACDICAREFCDSQTSLEDLAECYRLGYERLRATLTAVADALETILDHEYVGDKYRPAAQAALRSIGRQSHDI